MSLKTFADALPDYAKDLRLNLSSILNDQLLGEERKHGLLLACAHGSGYKPLVDAAEAEVAGKLSDQVANAARGAAALMAMNNVYYRFVHLVANPEYGTMPAKLRMNLIGVARHREGRLRAVQHRRVGDERLRHVHRKPRARASAARREARDDPVGGAHRRGAEGDRDGPRDALA